MSHQRISAARGIAVVLFALVHVLDDQRDRRAGGVALEDARDDRHFVRFAALGGVARLAGAALVEPLLNVGLAQRQARRHAIDDAADPGPMAFAPGREPERVADTVAGHPPP